jgi:integrase
LGEYGSDKAKQAYADFVAQWTKSHEADVDVLRQPAPGTVLLVGEAFLHYTRHAEGYYVDAAGEPTSEIVVIKSVFKLIRQLLDSSSKGAFTELPVTQFGPKKLKALQRRMVELGHSRYYINKAIAVVKRSFTWAASEELIPGSVALNLKTVGGLKKGRTAAPEMDPVQPVGDDIINATLPHVSELAADVIRVMRLTGARPGEICGMLASEIDRSDSSCWKVRPGHHKTSHRDKSRVILLGPRVQEIALPRLRKAADDGRVFPITRKSLSNWVYRACKKAGIEPWHPNRVRHTYATEIRAQYGLEAAQILLGHTKADITQTYAERDMAKALDVARKIG